MEYTYDPNDTTAFAPTPNSMLYDTQKEDNGYNVIHIHVTNLTGTKPRKIEFYTSSGIGSNIRDAESGQYYNERVGSYAEDLFFKVILANGLCKSKNNSSTLFFSSPRHYMSHMHCDLEPSIIAAWETKYAKRVAIIKSTDRKSVV